MKMKEKLGTKVKSARIDWMYEGPGAAAAASASDRGVGSNFDLESSKTTEDYLLGKTYKPKTEPANAIKELDAKPGSLWLSKQTNNQNEVFSRLQEDPLVLIRQRELKAREDVVHNPVKMAKIKAQLQKKIEEKKAKKEAKKAKKAAKKAKKKKILEIDKHSQKSRPESESLADNGHSSHRHDFNSQDRHKRQQEQITTDRFEYGLQGGKKRPFSKEDLGPSQKALEKAQAKNMQEQRFTKREKLTEDEKRKRLKQMEEDANTYESLRKERSIISRKKDQEERKKEEDRHRKSLTDPKFLRDMNKEVYATGTSMEERIKRNKHFHQAGADSHKFMNR